MPPVATTRVATNVRAAMRARGIVQTDLAARVGLSQPALSRRLVGEVPFDVNELERIAVALDVSAVDLLGQAERRSA